MILIDSARTFVLDTALTSIDQLPDSKINVAELSAEQRQEITEIKEYIKQIVQHLYNHDIELIEILKSNLTFTFYGRCANTNMKHCQTVKINFDTKYGLAFKKSC